MHDWWMYQVISAFGVVVYDANNTILYRQHDGNVVGASFGIKLWVNRIKRYLGTNNRAIRYQANELLRVYGSEMSSQCHKLVSEFIAGVQGDSVFYRLAYAIRAPVFRQRIIDDLVLRALIIIGRI